MLLQPPERTDHPRPHSACNAIPTDSICAGGYMDRHRLLFGTNQFFSWSNNIFSSSKWPLINSFQYTRRAHCCHCCCWISESSQSVIPCCRAQREIRRLCHCDANHNICYIHSVLLLFVTFVLCTAAGNIAAVASALFGIVFFIEHCPKCV